jgi:hypothetical protein
MEKPQDMVVAADRVHAAAVRGGLPGRPAQGAQPGGVDEADLTQVGQHGVC